jgi:putative Mg2+ transporter-C (MgtC) family protein
MTEFDPIASYWSTRELFANGLILLHLLGALLPGLLVGYPEFWYGGHASQLGPIDPTRIIQGVVAGIGFLGAGVIVREGFTISGLTTAASIWTSSVIGILVGIGLYLAAMGLSRARN